MVKKLPKKKPTNDLSLINITLINLYKEKSKHNNFTFLLSDVEEK